MSFPRYERYKESWVEWLGEVPEHWEVVSLKRRYNVVLGKMLQPEAKTAEEQLLPYLRAANIQWSGVDTSDIKQMWFSPLECESLRLLDGDLLISEGGDVGRAAIWRNELAECYFQNSVNRVRGREGQSTTFLYYWMCEVKAKGFIDALCNKSTIAHFTAEKVAVVPIVYPPAEEQLQIAKFLDRRRRRLTR